MKKAIIVFSLMLSLLLGCFFWAALYGSYLKGEKHNDFILQFSLLVIVTIVCVFLFKILFKKEISSKAGKNFKPFITLEYEVYFWRKFKRKEYNSSLKKRIKSTFYIYLMFFVLSGVPIMLYLDFKGTIVFLGYVVWLVVISLIGVLIYEYETFLKVRDKHLNVTKPIITINSNGFTINGDFVVINIGNSEDFKSSLSLGYVHETLCLKYYTTKKEVVPDGEYGDTEVFLNRNYRIPIPSNKKEELKKLIKILERNKNVKINTELLESY